MILLTSDKSLFSKLCKVVFCVFVLITTFACASQNVQNRTISKDAEQTILEKVRHNIVKVDVGLEEGARTVDFSVSYPDGKGKYPLIVFSHGHALDNLSYRNLTDYWVERGYVVVAPLHLDSGGDLEVTSKITEKYGSDWIAASRLLELGTAIDQAQQIATQLESFQGEILTDKVIAAGHSYGALSSQQLSGAKVELLGNSIYPIPETLVNDRVVAVVAVSPPGLMKDHLSEVTWQEYSTPQIVVTGPNDFFPFIWPNYEDHFISYETALPGNNYLLVLDEMDHYLGNLIGRLERDGPPQTLALTNLREISMQFIEYHLSSKRSENSAESFSTYLTSLTKDGVLRFEHR